MNENRTLVLGIGNTLLGDDGVGVHALRALQAAAKRVPDVTFVDGGTLSLALLPEIAAARRWIVFDAANLGAPAGTVRVFEGAAMDGFLGHRRRQSVHEVSLLDLVNAALLTGALPARRALIAIQPQVIGWRVRPGPAVSAAIPEACRLADALVRRWRDHAGQEGHA